MNVIFLRWLFISCCVAMTIHQGTATDLDGTTNVVFEESSVDLANGDMPKGFVRFDDGFTVSANFSVTLSVIPPVKGAINLNATGKIVLNSDLFLASNVTLPQGGVIDGQGNVIFLQGNLTIPRGKKLKIAGNTVIDGQGHELILASGTANVVGGIILIDGPEGTSLTLRNVNVKGLRNYTGNRGIRFGAAENQALILDNAIVNLSGDFIFTGGALKVHNDAMIVGAHTFTFKSSYDCTIESVSTLMLDLDVIFKYQPEDKQKDHLVMTDNTSRLFLNGCTLNTPRLQAMVLTKGHVIVDHKSYIDGDGDLRAHQGTFFGDGTLANNVFLDIMPGASLEIIDGNLTYDNVDQDTSGNSGGHRNTKKI